MDQERVRELIGMFHRETEAAAASKGPHTGMHVPYHGAFANATPSVIRDLRWYARELTAALAVKPEVQL